MRSSCSHCDGKLSQKRLSFGLASIRFTRAFADHMLSYALGRGLTPADSPALDRISAKTIADGYRLQTLLHEVVQSAPFINNPRQKTASAERPKNSIKTKR